MAFQDIDDEELAELFKILGHPLRMKIVKLLADGPLSYTSLLSRLDQQSTGTLNFHLNKLKVLLEKKDEAYRLNDIGTKAVSLMVSYSQNIEETGLSFNKKKANEFSWERLVELPIYYLPLIATSLFLINIFI